MIASISSVTKLFNVAWTFVLTTSGSAGSSSSFLASSKDSTVSSAWINVTPGISPLLTSANLASIASFVKDAPFKVSKSFKRFCAHSIFSSSSDSSYSSILSYIPVKTLIKTSLNVSSVASFTSSDCSAVIISKSFKISAAINALSVVAPLALNVSAISFVILKMVSANCSSLFSVKSSSGEPLKNPASSFKSSATSLFGSTPL